MSQYFQDLWLTCSAVKSQTLLPSHQNLGALTCPLGWWIHHFHSTVSWVGKCFHFLLSLAYCAAYLAYPSIRVIICGKGYRCLGLEELVVKSMSQCDSYMNAADAAMEINGAGYGGPVY